MSLNNAVLPPTTFSAGKITPLVVEKLAGDDGVPLELIKPAPRALLLPAIKLLPAFKIVAPVYELLPVKVMTPDPATVTVPVPLIGICIVELLLRLNLRLPLFVTADVTGP